jgi:hypothetical protein
VDAGIITAIVGLLGALGTGAWKLIDRADKKRERREIKVEELLKARVANLEAALRRKTKYCSAVKSHAGKWRDQLLVNDIEPVPEEWPEEEEPDA